MPSPSSHRLSVSVALSRARSADTMPIQFHFQSQTIPAYEWLELITLCLTPYATHILVGLAPSVVTSLPPPPWHKWINLYNPTTILWRYLMVADRRVRCRAGYWTPAMMAVTNAIFWTGRGWDGSEAAVRKYQRWLVRTPTKSTVELLSAPMVAVVVVIGQGGLALYQAIAIAAQGRLMFDGLASVFLPLSIVSLFRLLPARWLAVDFAFRNAGDHDGDGIPLQDLDHPFVFAEDNVGDGADADPFAAAQFESQVSYAAVLLRFTFMLLILLLFVAQVFHIMDWFHNAFSVASVSEHLLYHMLTTVTLVVFTTYLVRGEGNTTVLPCVNSPWYTCYTIFWYLFGLYVIILNCLETRRTSCGIYTTLAPSAGQDSVICPPQT